MQHTAETPAELSQSSATIGSIVTAADADEGVHQPYQQPLAIAAVPFSLEEGAAAAPESQNLFDEALASLDAIEKQDRQQFKLRKAEYRETRKQILAARVAHAPRAQPMQSPQQKPSQKPPQTQQPAKQPAKKAPKQPQHQPAKQPAKQPAPRFAEVLAAGCGAMVSAMLPAAMQTQPQWQQQPHQRKAQRPKQQQQTQKHSPQQQQQQQQRQRPSAAVGVDRFPQHLHFTLSGKGVDTRGSAAEVVRRAVTQVDGGAGVVVVDAVRLGPAAAPRFQFKVATHEQADTLVRGRGKAFAGSGIVLSEVLSPAETALHKQMYPDFLRLKEAGHRVQFRRARLFVDGHLWSKMKAAAA
jgi:hypothetical protein